MAGVSRARERRARGAKINELIRPKYPQGGRCQLWWIYEFVDFLVGTSGGAKRRLRPSKRPLRASATARPSCLVGLPVQKTREIRKHDDPPSLLRGVFQTDDRQVNLVLLHLLEEISLSQIEVAFRDGFHVKIWSAVVGDHQHHKSVHFGLPLRLAALIGRRRKRGSFAFARKFLLNKFTRSCADPA
jgi:hypothetical protein